MNTTEILSAIDDEISRLTQVRGLLGGLDTAAAVPGRPAPGTAPKRGRPKGSKNKATSFNPRELSGPKRRTMSPEGRVRIAAAQRARWARRETADAAHSVSKKTAAVSKAAPAKSTPKSSTKAPAGQYRTVSAKRVGTKVLAAAKSAPDKKAAAKSTTVVRTAASAKKKLSEGAPGRTSAAKVALSRTRDRAATATGASTKKSVASSHVETPSVTSTATNSSAE